MACSLYEPTLVELSATPSAILPGEQAVLRWTTTIDTGGALPIPGVTDYSLKLMPDNVDVTRFSSYLAAPTETTTYTLQLNRQGEISEAKVTVEVLPVNKAPLAKPLSLSTVQSSPLNLTLQGSDPDGDTLRFIITDAPTGGAVSSFNETTGTLTYTPEPGFTGKDTFSFAVSDGDLISTKATVLITVKAVPEEPEEPGQPEEPEEPEEPEQPEEPEEELDLFIDAPEADVSYTTRDKITLGASAFKGEEDISGAVNWSSDLDGSLGIGRTLEVRLTRGIHTLTAEVSQGEQSIQASVKITVLGPWTRQIGTAGIDVAYGVTTDSEGNVFVTGYTEDNLGGKSAGNDDLFLLKYDTEGTLIWKTQVGSSSYEFARDLATDAEGNIYMTGYTLGDLEGKNAGSYDLFIIKFDPSGKKLWTQQVGTNKTEHAYGIATDSKGNIYTTGFTNGNLEGTNAGLSDLFVLKYAPDGKLLWTRQFGTEQFEYARGIATDADDNVFIAGYTNGGLDGANSGNEDLFVIKYNAEGERLWTTQLGTATSDVAYGVATDVNGDAYIAGYTEGGLGGNELFVMKFSKDGNQLWTQRLGSTKTNYARGVATDADGNVYATGYTDGALDGNTSAGDFDIFFIKYNSNGSKLASWQLGTIGPDYAYSIATDAEGSAYVAGFTSGDLDGNVSSGGYDVFLLKYDRTGIKQ